MRLFIAIEIPTDLKRVLEKLRCNIPSARWIDADQIHLTLAFLGEVEESRLKRLTEALSQIRTAPFTLHPGQTGCFPGRQRPRVLWVGVKPEQRLSALAAEVRESLQACGIAQEERHFSPHITLARVKAPLAGACDQFLERKADCLPSFAVLEFLLFQSTLKAGGAVHAVLESFPLKG